MAAGLGFKTFATGDVLTAADANGYLMSQTVMVFADATARSAAITSPQEGMITYLKDTNVTQYYSGSAWVAVGGSSPLTTKGDLYTYSTADARLGVGANDTVLTADSTAATGLKWAAAATGGMTQLATGTLSGATTTVSSIPGTYKDLQIIVRNYDPTTDGSGLNLRMNSDSTASRHFTGSSYGQTQGGVFTQTFINLTADQDNAVNQGLTEVTIFDYANTTTWKMCDFLSVNNNPTTTTQLEARVGYGVYNQTSAITSLDFIVSGGAAGGTYFIYGVK